MKIVSLLISLAFLAACAGTSPSADPATGSSPADNPNYVIGAGDNLRIDVWNNPEVSAEVPVRPDGRISTPLVEDMIAVGKSPADLARDIETVLAEFIRNPKVTVIVTQFVGAYSEQIRVVGEATNPRALSFRDRMTLLDVIIEVGGLGEFAAGNRAKIIRWQGDEQVEIPVRVDDLVKKGKIGANVLMRPGDVLIIPRTRF